jgi:hypothetical protein
LFFTPMKPEDRLHRSLRYAEAPRAAPDRPPLLLSQLGQHARVRLVCGACAWSKTYSPHRLAQRLSEKGAGGPSTAIAHVARHVQWPCPGCRRMAWVSQPERGA